LLRVLAAAEQQLTEVVCVQQIVRHGEARTRGDVAAELVRATHDLDTARDWLRICQASVERALRRANDGRHR
jgi:hypothetical protein